MPFSSLPPLLSEALAARGYAAPTPVQAAVLEPEADGRDLIVSAQTGSGKTVAFGLAIAPQLLEATACRARARRWRWRSRRRASWRCRSAASSTGSTARPARGSRPASAAWTRRRSGARWPRARTSSSARPGACATISSAARSTSSKLRVGGARRGRRDARHGLPRGSRGDPRRDARRAPHPAVLGDDAQADRRARQALSARRAAHLDRGRRSRAWRHQLSGDDGCARRHRERGRQPAALPRGGNGDAVLRDARQCAPPAREPDRARLRRRGAVGRAQPERAQPGAAGAARPPRAGLRRDRRRRARHRPADAVARRPCRAAARRRDAAAPIGPDRARRQEGHGGADRALSAPPPGRDDAARRAHRRPNGSRRRRPRISARATASACWPRCSQPVEIDDEDRELAKRLLAERSAEDIAAALVRAHRARMPAPEELLDRGAAGAARGRTARGRASRTPSGSA